MELPFHLRALPPEALDVLRFFSGLDEPIAHASLIMDEVGLSERLFGKVVRRLVTKGYLQMSGDQIYRLSDLGGTSVEELAAYDESAPPEFANEPEPATIAQRQVYRHLVAVFPRPLTAGSPADIYVGFSPASSKVDQAADLVVRFSIVNGEPSRPQEKAFNLADGAAYQVFRIVPGAYQQVRLRLVVYQLGPNPDDITVAGGMYVDVPVVSMSGGNGLSAYGVDVVVTL